VSLSLIGRRAWVLVPSVALVLTAAPPAQAAPIVPVEPLRMTATVIRIADARVMSTDGAVSQIGIKGREFQLSSDVLFDFDKWNLKPRAVKELTRIAGLLKAQAGGEDPVTTVAVTGHTDNQGSDAYNVRLSNRRAASVQALLRQQLGGGITVTAAGRGETQPIASNAKAKGRQQNRRVEIKAND
jgi:outer membrane protein OmpA-like peptidoglycan-associated protein